jgi:cytochrome P450
MGTRTAPTSRIDLFDEELRRDPYPAYRELRDMGPAVYLASMEMWALGRYADVRAALSDWTNLTSVNGVGFNEPMNAMMADTVICADPPQHEKLRAIVVDRMTPGALRNSDQYITERADAYVDLVLEKGSFDAAWLAGAYPAELVAHLVGFPPHIGERLVDWSEASFDAVGPMNAAVEAAFPTLSEMLGLLAELGPEDLRPGSIGRAAYDAAQRGDIPFDKRVDLLWNFTGPALDSTISALGTALWQLAESPEQWTLLRDTPSLAPGATNEALRYEAPIPQFTRVVRHEWNASGTTLPVGDRVAVIYASANRDERHYDDPDRFDIRRDARDHVAFGHGIHACAGAPLARMEISGLLAALAKRVATLEPGEPIWHYGNLVKKIKSLPVKVQPA